MCQEATQQYQSSITGARVNEGQPSLMVLVTPVFDKRKSLLLGKVYILTFF